MLNRAYSILDVKEITDDGEFYTIKGMATTPTPDRVGDIVEPLGARYAKTIPLLWQHEHSKPVGQAELGKATKKGIPFTARLPIIKEPGILKDRIDEAIQSIRYRLVAAVSIGFRVLNDAIERIETGYRYIETEILELSLATIPAQTEATISNVKSLDKQLLASSSRGQRSVALLVTPPDVSGTKPAAKRGPVKLIPRNIKREDSTGPDQRSGKHPCR